MADLPVGTVTLLFTDIEGSTRLLQRLGARYAGVLAEHHRLLGAAANAHRGRVVDTQGDAVFVAFPRAVDAVASAAEAQRALAAHPWPEGAEVRVRMGLHTGEPERAAGGYVGLDVHRAARLCATGHGGQVLLSRATAVLLEQELPPGLGLRDLGEHRLKDLQRPEHVFQLAAQGLPADFPPLRTLDTLPNNLPTQLTSFVGREREMAEVRALIGSARLLTLVGAGGAGKTRLALQVAADLLDHFRDGVWLAELAPLADPALVPKAVASALGVRELAGRPFREVLLDYLRPRELLLVLDNCEHLVVACAELADALLHGCPQLRVLATSREPLAIAGETTWRVPSLSLPDPRQPLAVEQVDVCEAVRLFIDRAVAAVPGFAVTNENAPAVAQICHRLDGIPLAIELAAARVRVLSAEQIAARLDDRFRLLTGGSRTALPRQQTLRALIDWSYNLLPEPERAVLRRLSVFAGGWALEAAEAVCAGAGIDEPEVLDLLVHLVEKSLVVTEQQGGEARYRLLETVRQYGRDRLREAGEEVPVRDLHLAYYLQLAERAEVELRGAEAGAWLERVGTEFDNLRAAVAWGRAAPAAGSDDAASRAERALRLVAALWLFFVRRGHHDEALAWLEDLLPKTAGAGRTRPRARALNSAAWFAMNRGDHDQARPLVEESLAICRELDDRPTLAYAVHFLGHILQGQGDRFAALPHHERSIALCREQGDRWHLAQALACLGTAALRVGKLDEAQRHLEESVALFRALGDQWNLCFPLLDLGGLAYYRGDLARARAILEPGVARARELGVETALVHGLRYLADVALGGDDHGQAAALLREYLEVAERLGMKSHVAEALRHSGYLARARGEARAAGRLFGAAEQMMEELRWSPAPIGHAEYNRHLRAARAELGEQAFEAEWAEGRAMTPEQAAAYALGEPLRTARVASRTERLGWGPPPQPPSA